MAIRFIDEEQPVAQPPKRKITFIDDPPASEPVAAPLPTPAPMPTTATTYADKSTYEGMAADIPRKNAMKAQADQATESMIQEKAQEVDASKQELDTEFGWLVAPFKSQDPVTQNVINDMVKIWKDEKSTTADKLAKLRKLRDGAKRIFAARQQEAGLSTEASEIGLQEKALRMPYLAAKGTASGLTMGASDIALNKAEEALGGRVAPQTTGEAALGTIGQLAGGVATGRIAAGALGKSLTQMGAKGLTQFVGTRLATNIGMTTARQINGMIAGDIKPAEAAGNFAQNVGAGIVAMIPELAVPAGVGNAVAQVATDLAYDFVTDLWRGKVDASSAEGLQKWFIETEIPQLVNSMLFAGMDLADPNFKTQQVALKQEFKDRWQGKIEVAKPIQSGVMDAEIKEPPTRVELPKPTDSRPQSEAGAVPRASEVQPDTEAKLSPTIKESGDASVRDEIAITRDMFNALDKAIENGDQIAIHTIKQVIQRRPQNTVDAILDERIQARSTPPSETQKTLTPTDETQTLTAKEQAEIEAEAKPDLTPELTPVKPQAPTRLEVPETPKPPPPVTPPPESTKADTPPPPEVELKLSKHPEKLAEFFRKKGHTKLAKDIESDPENYYRVVKDKQVREYIEPMGRDELRDLAMNTPKSDIANRSLSIAAGAKLESDLYSERVALGKQRYAAEKAGDKAKAEQLKIEIEARQEEIKNIENVVKERSSDAGYTLRSTQIYAMETPRKQVNKIIAKLQDMGYNVKPTTEEKLTITMNDAKNAYEALENYKEKFRNGEVDWNAGVKQMAKLEGEFNEAVTKAQSVVHAIAPAKFSDLAISNIQGALLSLKSLFRNPAYNLSYLASVHYPEKILSTMQDAMRGKMGNLIGLDAQRTTEFRKPLKALQQHFSGMGKGLKQAGHVMRRGYTEGGTVLPGSEPTTHVAPGKAIMELVNVFRDPKNSDLPTVTGKDGKEHVPAKVAAYKAMEALSFVSQGMLRGLPLGDRPSIEAVKTKVLSDIGSTEYGLKGEALDRFVRAPSDAMDRLAEMDARRVSQQEDNAVTKQWISMTQSAENVPIIGPPLKLLLRGGVSPFMKTLVNVARQSIELTNPFIPGTEAAYHSYQAVKLGKENPVKNREAIRDHIKKAQDNTSRAIVGWGLAQIAGALAGAGIWSDSEWAGEKAAAKKHAQMGTGRLNLSGLGRLIAGKVPVLKDKVSSHDPQFQDGDVTVSTLWLGVPGFVMNVHNNIQKKREREAQEPEGWLPQRRVTKGAADVLDRIMPSLNAILEVPIAKGGLAMADSIKTGDFGFLEDLMSTLTAPFHPNVFKDSNKFDYRELRQRKGVGNIADRITDRLIRETMLAASPLLTDEKLDKILPKIYSPFTGETVPSIPRKSGVGRALWAIDPFEVTSKDLHPAEAFLHDLQKRVEEAGLPNDVYPPIPTRRTKLKDKAGKERALQGNRDLLQKLNRIHGEETAKIIKQFQETKAQNPNMPIKAEIRAWKRLVSRAEKAYRKRAEADFGLLIEADELETEPETNEND